MSETESLRSLPVLPIKNAVLFPYLAMPLSAGRPSTIAAVEAAAATEEKEILVFAQRNDAETPSQDDLYPIGTRAIIRRMSRSQMGGLEMVVQGIERVVLIRFDQTEPYIRARFRPLPLPEDRSTEVDALYRAIIDLAGRALRLHQPDLQVDPAQLLGAAGGDPLRLIYMIGSMLSLDLEREQALLSAESRADALRLMHAYLTHEVDVLELRNQINTQAQSEMTKQQREYMLRQQLRAIQQELGEQDPEQAEVAELRSQFDKADLPDHVRQEVERELSRLEKLPSQAPDYNIIRSYLELVLELPWRKSTEDILDITRARQVLDEDHFDLKEVKERILEQLGVLKLNPTAKAPILCFVGPPGVGKTSLGQSIARALNRKFERISLGGLHDEAELRGHRRTYIGALPGRIIQGIRRAGANNPVLMLDEIDKLGRDFRGDPAAALLEILDPAQNNTFLDNYLNLTFDLSKVLFIATANTLDTVPQPLLDRMEVLALRGYSEEEKLEIAKRYLLPRQMKETGLTPEQFSLSDETLRRLTTRYTREAGVRQLERAIGRVARRIALLVAEGKPAPASVGPEDLAELIGPERFQPEQARRKMPAGVATGLAWTEAGGEVLYIEATLLPEGQGLTLTGQLGAVMQESAKAAQSYLWSHADMIGIDPDRFRKSGVHIHVPAGAVPKDGPSAGVTMATALTSVYTGLPARTDTAMTGEITLTGLVFPIGGVKEKVLAARRVGIKRVILPKGNEKDLRELPDEVKLEMEFVFAERIEEVLSAAIPALAERLAGVGVG